MNILFDHQIFCLQKYGGISRYFYELANHIADRSEEEVKIFAPVHINEYLPKSGIVRPNGIKIQELSGFGRIAAWGFDTALAYVALKPRRDVDIFHETYYSGVDCCPRAAKRILTIFDMTHEKFPEMSPGRSSTRQTKARAVERADHVLCISENTRSDLISLLGVPEEKTSVVHLGYSLSVNEVKRPAISENPYILFVGQRGGYKNFISLLRAYAKTPALKEEFSLVCFGGGEFSGQERALIESHQLSSTRVMHLSGGDEVLAGLYSGAAAFIYPSLYEGFGIPPLEAMSFGCPVICSNSSSLPEVVGDAAELFDPTNEGDMLAAIFRVLHSPKVSQLLIARGFERIKQFSWEKCAKDTLDVYNKVLQG